MFTTKRKIEPESRIGRWLMKRLADSQSRYRNMEFGELYAFNNGYPEFLVDKMPKM